MAIPYRREIDGLRALAVIPVILFHAGIPGFSGGFIGVDVFFVISGFLITSILISENEQKKFSVLNFYERRARRILPALFLVMMVSVAIAWFTTTPKDMKDFSLSLASVPLFSSNFLFWSLSGYFDTSSELKPMLHTWSLAVEEQYYIIFPIVLLSMWRFGRGAIVALLICIGISSFSYSQFWLKDSPDAIFYLLHARCWELIVGALVAFYCYYQRHNISSGVFGQLLGMIGLVMVGLSVFRFDEKTPFPGAYALIPVIGSVLIIVFADSKTLVGRILSLKPVVFVGLISYSAYLWHQPLFAFARLGETEKLGIDKVAFLIGLTLALAYISWRYVEAPFRSKDKISRRKIFAYSAAGSVAFLAIGLTGYHTNGFENRLTDEQAILLSFERQDMGKYSRLKKCFLDQGQDPESFSKECYGSAHGGIVIWGDSHAAALSYGLIKQEKNVTQLTAGSCPPLKDVTIEWRPKCRSVNDFAINKIVEMKPSVLVMHANWDTYHWQNPVEEIAKTVAYIHEKTPGTRVVVVGLVPKWPVALPTYMFKKGVHLDKEHYMKTSLYGVIEDWDKRIGSASGKSGYQYFSVFKELCREGECKASLDVDGEIVPTAWDYGHYTRGGSIAVARKLVDAIHSGH
ncbi:acyltransferase family protein [Pseudomonas sp. BRM28]|uniref:acyltransferase family protein n=1 Tax=Pseudomonas sp. BRM28 TaxID=2045201 RepID=UPI000CEE4C4A|nr:acyltransferase family protein [Pseudomonas sp. BRM28]PPS62624.1 acyltransferase [Pseudomonas sp. BRM28]